MEEYIKLLELPEEFDLNDLKMAYRKKVLQYHPDKATNEVEALEYKNIYKLLITELWLLLKLTLVCFEWNQK